MSEKQKKGKWYRQLITNINSLAEELELTDGGTELLRDFVITVAKSHYRAGNSSGIAWMREKQRKKAGVN